MGLELGEGRWGLALGFASQLIRWFTDRRSAPASVVWDDRPRKGFSSDKLAPLLVGCGAWQCGYEIWGGALRYLKRVKVLKKCLY